MSDDNLSLLGKIAAFTEILAKDPQSTVFVSLCEAYRQMGMLDDALDIAQKGTQRLQGFSPGFACLGRIHAQRGDLNEAAAAFEKALTIENENLAALKGLARVRYQQGYSDRAKGLVTRALEISPDDPVLLKMHASLGMPLASTPGGVVDPQAPPGVGQAAKANAPVQSESPFKTETVADLYCKQGLLADAAQIYRDLLRQNPQNQRVREKLVAVKVQLQPPSGEALESPAASRPDPQDAKPVMFGEKRPEIVETSSAISPETVLERWLTSIQQRRTHV